jgi:hypothetical protein
MEMRNNEKNRGRMARGDHGLPKVVTCHALPFYALQVDHPLKWPYSRFRGGLPAGGVACGCLLPLVHPTPYAYERIGRPTK